MLLSNSLIICDTRLLPKDFDDDDDDDVLVLGGCRGKVIQNPFVCYTYAKLFDVLLTSTILLSFLFTSALQSSSITFDYCVLSHSDHLVCNVFAKKCTSGSNFTAVSS